MAGNFWQSSHYQQWILDRQEIVAGRSHDLKVFSDEEYQKIMIFYANFMQLLGENLKVRNQVIATATLYFKRFYARNSLKSIDPLLLAPTCTFLAAKVEEFGQLSQTKLITTCSMIVKTKLNYAFNQDFPYRIQDVLNVEFYLLEVLDCCLICYLPYRPLQIFCQDLGMNSTQNEALLSFSWKIVNDSLRSDACLMYAPSHIALACLHIAGIVLNRDLRNWFSELNVDLDKVLEVVRVILHLYQLWKAFDEKKEIGGILQRIPKPSSSPSRPSSAMANKDPSGPSTSQSMM